MLVALLDVLLGQTQSPDSRTQTRVLEELLEGPDIESLSASYVWQLHVRACLPHSGSCEVARRTMRQVFSVRAFASLRNTFQRNRHRNFRKVRSSSPAGPRALRSTLRDKSTRLLDCGEGPLPFGPSRKKPLE